VQTGDALAPCVDPSRPLRAAILFAACVRCSPLSMLGDTDLLIEVLKLVPLVVPDHCGTDRLACPAFAHGELLLHTRARASTDTHSAAPRAHLSHAETLKQAVEVAFPGQHILIRKGEFNVAANPGEEAVTEGGRGSLPQASVCVRAGTCAPTRACVYTHAHTHAYTLVRARAHTHTHTRTHTHTHTQTHTHTHTHTHRHWTHGAGCV